MTELMHTDNIENGVQHGHANSRAGSKRKSLMIVEDDVVVGPPSNSVQLPLSVLKKLYHTYSIKQRRGGLKWFLIASLLFNIWLLIIPQGQCLEALFVTMVVFCINLLICILLHLNYLLSKPDSSTGLQRLINIFIPYAPHVLWTVCIIHLVLYILLQESVSPRDALGWAILMNFLIYVTLPVTLLYTGCLFGIGTVIFYLGALLIASRRDPMLIEQILANAVLILTAAVIGLLYYFMGEAKQKRTFVEAKKSLEVKMVIEEQSAEQERLLLSVLPKHVAVKMRQDLGSTSSEPFKKIYMSRHENVSILYADIVGFTAISSTYSAQDLVKMLNELFARFDRLAEKYQQLRIKILGDCYYCISGAPDERPDHAVLCVHMGLSMVKAIKYVQQKTNSPVDMRVGIHTGAVLAGILGQRQWQFDVYSKDVELANKMESSGKAGRVHISDKTLAFLTGEFEVEPAYGEKREEALRIAGLKTYFITKVLKPFASPCAKKTIESQDIDNDQETLDEELLKSSNGKNLKNDEIETEVEILDKQTVFKQRLEEELVARDGHENLSQNTTLFLKFKNKNLEIAYAAYREPYSSVPLIAALLVQCVDIVYSFIVLPRSPLHFVNISAPIIPIFMLVFISIAESFPEDAPEFFVSISKRFNDITFVRELAAIIIAVTLGLSNVIDMYFFLAFVKTEHIVTEGEFNVTTVGFSVTESVNEPLEDSTLESDFIVYPSYMSNFAVLILISIAVIAQLTHVTKIVLMLIIAALHCYWNMFIMNDLYAFEDHLAKTSAMMSSFCASGTLVVVTVALSFFARHMDREDRVIFKWKTEVAEQKDMATDMRQRNEALVYNVLPVHVAEHFMKNTKRSHDDLYSQSYAEVGVLFASMPNFSDFYSEETVNNQGLECLRFLNEVISDFDALLELPQFQDIIKIKTIGSTYMAASGININRISHPDDPITKRWAHLSVLVEFALELKNALQGINEQSFNHFVLKMGINHGPITAGVIGARKPHYDIWGNTVNVASRMESTGKAGAIQVTEETCNILQEFGYTFQQRGLVSVKGKGQLMTYYLIGKSDKSGYGGHTKLSPNDKRSQYSGSPPTPRISKINETDINQIQNIIIHKENYSKSEESEEDIKASLLTPQTNGGSSLDYKTSIDNETNALLH
ncbi:adenylate cyclase type 3 [Teleopsis dalmanni]|uniref:adenylate cyclase type 3 n=1 Tax=Teleopsis dalmanni TaxID=139649 RepID=UPI0018CEB13A|nr:adenylate cyclase type 3 [Teleopsis dalmanni]